MRIEKNITVKFSIIIIVHNKNAIKWTSKVVLFCVDCLKIIHFSLPQS